MVEKNVGDVVEKVVKAATRTRKPKVTASQVVAMTCEKLPAPIGPFQMGKMIVTPHGTWGYSSGQLGVDPSTKKLIDEKPAL